MKEYIEGKNAKLTNLSKTSKKEAERLIADIDKILMADKIDFYSLGAHVKKLERYFAPKDTPKTISSNPVKWVLQAVWTKDNTRSALKVAKCCDGFLAATDGRRLHVYEGYTEHKDGAILPDGSWINETVYKRDFGVFPKWEQVIPYTKEKRKPEFKPRQDVKGHLVYDLEIVSMGCNRVAKSCVDEKFLKQSLAGMENPEYFQDDELTPLLIKGGKRVAVIMPIRIS